MLSFHFLVPPIISQMPLVLVREFGGPAKLCGVFSNFEALQKELLQQGNLELESREWDEEALENCKAYLFAIVTSEDLDDLQGVLRTIKTDTPYFIYEVIENCHTEIDLFYRPFQI
jgi:hypothetical protein